MQGEKAADTVRRLRLNRVAIELLDAASPIERIARRAGYSSQAAFTRAFRSAYGMPPACYQSQRELSRQEQPHAAITYPVEIADCARIPLAAMSHRGNYHQERRSSMRSWRWRARSGNSGPKAALRHLL
jgi:AraC family transcriptional regulator